jgi:hypothetical protein
MEIPDDLKRLYRHWDRHLSSPGTGGGDTIQHMVPQEPPLDDILWFVRERMKIWQRKTVGEDAPYTEDAVLSRYRFCNIFREFDRQTIEFHVLLAPLRGDLSLWMLNMFYCRMVARTETVREVGLLSFDRARNAELYERFMASPRPRFGTPYVFPVSAIQRGETPTRELFITRHLPLFMKRIADEIETWDKISVLDGVERVIPLFGYNLRFLWTEVLIDVAYQFPQHIDLFGLFPVGPGSLPTMRRIDTSKDPAVLVRDLSGLEIDVGLTCGGIPVRLSTENWEGIGCEYRKYSNLKAGKGRKRRFV